ncbi:MAG TPA: hypothetical protein VGY66_34110 [Gemmataceae bacterium]|jgi:hypothetical protein|nr:hypothetical protein [Gemmataceae bacterium]
MQFQFDMSSRHYPPLNAAAPPATETDAILRQLVEIQREQLASLKALLGAHDGAARWRAFLARWRNDFPELSDACKQAMPVLEKMYGKLIAEMTEHLSQSNAEDLDNDFTLQDFLDRYGIRLSQLGSILNMVAPFAEAGSPSESA